VTSEPPPGTSAEDVGGTEPMRGYEPVGANEAVRVNEAGGLEPGLLPPPPASGGWSRRRKGGVIGLIAALIAIPGAKLLLGIGAASLASGLLAGAFGGPYDRVPQQIRDGWDKRIEAAIPGVASMSSSAASDQALKMFADGFVRLDDASEARLGSYILAALAKVDDATCAALVRSKDPGAEAKIGSQALATMDVASVQDFYEIAVQAIEASGRQSPPARVTSSADMEAVLAKAFSGVDPTSVAAINDATATNAAVCAAVRVAFDAIGTLSVADQAVFWRGAYTSQ
jgi:hypothetical protein